jgi:hypothetical protein
MASNKPFTFDDLVNAHAEANSEEVAIRPHTVSYRASGMDHFAVFLYEDRIADVYPEAVRVYKPRPTATTKNRINDALIPLKWRVVVQHGKWHVQTTEPPYRSMEFISGMILTRIANTKDAR